MKSYLGNIVGHSVNSTMKAALHAISYLIREHLDIVWLLMLNLLDNDRRQLAIGNRIFNAWGNLMEARMEYNNNDNTRIQPKMLAILGSWLSLSLSLSLYQVHVQCLRLPLLKGHLETLSLYPVMAQHTGGPLRISWTSCGWRTKGREWFATAMGFLVRALTSVKELRSTQRGFSMETSPSPSAPLGPAMRRSTSACGGRVDMARNSSVMSDSMFYVSHLQFFFQV